MFFEKSLIFHPQRFPERSWQPIPQMVDIELTAADGVRLHAWHCPSSSQVTVLFLHGNGGNLTTRASLIQKLTQAPANVFALDYRGYGRSAGTPSEAGLFLDADAAWRCLTLACGIAPAHIIVFGESLGGAVAIDLAQRVQPGGLIVQSSFTSIPDLAVANFPFIPRRLIKMQMRSIDKIGTVRCPKLLIHSRRDRLIPFWMGRRLFDAAQDPKKFLEIADADHHNMEEKGGEIYLATVYRFLQTCLAKSMGEMESTTSF